MFQRGTYLKTVAAIMTTALAGCGDSGENRTPTPSQEMNTDTQEPLVTPSKPASTADSELPELPNSESGPSEVDDTGTSELPELPNPDSTPTRTETPKEYDWTGSEEHRNAQMSNYGTTSTDELCRMLKRDDALAAENCRLEEE